MNWFSLSLHLNRFPIKRAQKLLRDIQKIPESDYASYVEQKKWAIFQYHLETNSFYKDFCGGKTVTSWEQIPVMEKADLQRPVEERLSKGYSSKTVHLSKTSGSSGHPFIFAKDKFSHALSWAEFMDRYQWFGIDLNKSLQARFYGIPFDKIGYLKERIKDSMGSRYRFPIFNLNDEKMEIVLEEFRRRKFDYINGYTSSIVLFAKFLQKKGLRLKEIAPELKLCIVTSEMFFEEDRRLLENQFEVPIVNEYGASELGLLAFEDQEGNWVLNSESAYIEVVNDKNEVLPFGEEGKILITSLYNKAHPFIRYEIGDVGIIDPRSSPKKPILKKLTGRTSDIAYLPSGKVVPGLTFYYVTKSVIENDGSVKEFIVQQTAPARFKVIYVSENPLPIKKLKDVKRAMATYLEAGLEVEFQHNTFLDRSKRGKLKQFESLI